MLTDRVELFVLDERGSILHRKTCPKGIAPFVLRPMPEGRLVLARDAGKLLVLRGDDATPLAQVSLHKDGDFIVDGDRLWVTGDATTSKTKYYAVGPLPPLLDC